MVGTHFAHMDSHRVAWAIPVPVGPVGLVRAKVACFQLNSLVSMMSEAIFSKPK